MSGRAGDLGGRRLSRRRFLSGAASLGAALTLASCAGGPAPEAAGQLNIYSWPDYIDPRIIPEFERRYGIKVVYDTVSSNEGLLAKFQAGASNYDIVVPSGYMVRQLTKMGLLLPLDRERLPNFRHICERFRSAPFDPDCRYSVPYTFGTTGIAYSRSAFRRLGAAEPDDWDVFWDKRLSGRITLLDDPRETLGMAVKRRGHSYNTVDPGALGQALADLIEQKPLTMCYTSDQVIVYLASGDSLRFWAAARRWRTWAAPSSSTTACGPSSSAPERLAAPVGAHLNSQITKNIKRHSASACRQIAQCIIRYLCLMRP